MWMQFFTLFILLSASFSRATYTFSDSCDAGKQETLKKELFWARELAIRTNTALTTGPYYNTFFSDEVRARENWELTSSRVFTQISNQLNPDNDANTIEITCDNSNRKCQSGYYASMFPETNVMNFCDLYFVDGGKIESYEGMTANCSTAGLQDVHRTRSTIIVHVLTHSKYAMDPAPPTLDYAYGYNGCFLLAIDKFDRGCASYAGNRDPKGGRPILCPTAAHPPKDGHCQPDRTAGNADSWALIAAGVGWSSICNREIPLPPAPDTAPGRRSPNPRIALGRKRDACFEDDSLPFDGGPDYAQRGIATPSGTLA